MRERDMAWPAAESGTGAVVDRLIALSGARRMDHITVAGRKTLDVMLGLCRRGFLHATCRVAIEGPHDGEDPAASLWILDAENAAEMRTFIVVCGRDLRADGTVVINVDFLNSADNPDRLKDLLIKCGFVPLQKTKVRDRSFLLCARKHPVQEALAA